MTRFDHIGGADWPERRLPALLGNSMMLGAAAGAGTQYQITRSLRFNPGDGPYLVRTPGAAGNRRTFTISLWTKHCALPSTTNNSGHLLFARGVSSSLDFTGIVIRGSDRLSFDRWNQGSLSYEVQVTTTRVLRDLTAWYHLVAAVDTTQPAAADRVKLYVNGEQVTDLASSTYPSLNYQFDINATIAHYIGKYAEYANHYADGYMADVYFVDGQQLTPSSFGAVDSATGVWAPKKYAGSGDIPTGYGGDETSGGTVLYSTQHASYLAASAFDNTDDGNAWGAESYGPTPTNSYIGYDFGSAKHIRKLTINGASGLAGHQMAGCAVEYSSDGSVWTTLQNISMAAYTGTPQEFHLNSSGAYRYWRIRGLDANPAGGASYRWLVGEIRMFAATGASSYGANGFHLTLGDNSRVTALGDDANGAAGWAYSTSGAWSGATSGFSFSGDDITGSVADNAIRTTSSFGSFPLEFSYTAESVADNAGACSGLFDAAELGSFNTTAAGGTGGLQSMTKSWRLRHSDGAVFYGGSSVATLGDCSSRRVRWRIESSGTVRLTVDGLGTHTFASGASGISTHLVHATSNAGRTISAARWVAGVDPGNNWQPVNLSVAAGAANDSLTDTPTSYGTGTSGGDVRGNFCTMSPLANGGNTLSNGNLTIASAVSVITKGTIAVKSGKWYWEWRASSLSAGTSYCGVKAADRHELSTANGLGASGGTANEFGYGHSGNKQNNGGTTACPTFTTADTIACAIDLDAGKIWWAKNNVWINGGDPAAGTMPDYSTLTSPGGYTPAFGDNLSGTTIDFNFGQRPFAYAPPPGFKPLCTQHLTTPTVKDPRKGFGTLLYAGNSSTQSVTGLGFSPDLIWTKGRNVAVNHRLFDTMRGSTTKNKELTPNATLAEGGSSSMALMPTAIGFDFSDTSSTTEPNNSGTNYVAWCWKKAPAYGFDIVTYTGTGSNRTVGHGLGAVPKLMVIKSRGAVGSHWYVYHEAIGAGNRLLLNDTAASTAQANVWNGVAPTSNIFSLGDALDVNKNADTFVAYLWAEVAGFSRFGSYTGNGSSDGPFVWCGFRPAFVMVKRVDSANDWGIIDSARDPHNATSKDIYSNLTQVDGSTGIGDLLADGFKIRVTGLFANAAGGTYIFAAFAEQPFKYARAR